MSVRIKFPYEPGPDGRLRPYLWLVLDGPGGSVRVRGLLDSGANISLLPSQYASMLGLEADDLDPVPAELGRTALKSKRTVAAHLPGALEVEAPLRPAFIDAHTEPRWGRDFMNVWSVSFAEREQQFVLFAG